jgi:hypothetical protein
LRARGILIGFVFPFAHGPLDSGASSYEEHLLSVRFPVESVILCRHVS